jgi:hypothetical protein
MASVNEKSKTNKETEAEVSIFGEKFSEKDWGQSDAGSSVWGVFFLLVGLFLLGNVLQIISWEFWNYVWQFWPVLVVFLGIHIILGNNVFSRVLLFILAVVVFGLIAVYSLKQINSPLLENVPTDLVNFVNWLEDQRR